MSQAQSDDVTVSDHAERSRFEVTVDGELAGFADYIAQGDVLDFVHTEVFDTFGGQGLGKKLVFHALDEARSRGLGVLPHCALFQGMISKTPEYPDLVPADQRAEFDLA